MPSRILLILAVVTVAAVAIAGTVAALFSLSAVSLVLAGVAVALLVAFVLWLVLGIHRLPLRLLGLGAATSIPAIPVHLISLFPTVRSLQARRDQMQQALRGLSTIWRIGDDTFNAYTWMGLGSFSRDERQRHPETRRTLTEPTQFTMSWTTFPDVHRQATQNALPRYAPTLQDPVAATREFWPTISTNGVAYNLLILRAVPASDTAFKDGVGAAWPAEADAVMQAGDLFVIDMRFCAQFGAATVSSRTRFTPGTLTFLRRERDPASGVSATFAPFAIVVSGLTGSPVAYRDTDPAWLYALHAAKASITVWGIWIGHVYHWHIVTAAMQMTMFHTLPATHPVRQLLDRQSAHLIPFDEFLLLDWEIAPPTSVADSREFILMMDRWARTGRPFFGDDPRAMLTALGLVEGEFTDPGQPPFNRYPAARFLLEIYDRTREYVAKVVEAFYGADEDVAADPLLRAWIDHSSSPAGGNVSGLTVPTTLAGLVDVLTSILYRIVAHGASRMEQAANPALTFVPNFPPCLQSSVLPAPTADMTQFDRLAPFLPNTGTIGEYVSFLFTFVYSPPDQPLIPMSGDLEPEVWRAPASVAQQCNQALFKHRADIRGVMSDWAREVGGDPTPAQDHQWELSIET